MEHETRDEHGRQILTVGALRRLIDGLDDDTHVVIDDGDGWWHNVNVVGVPGDEQYECLSLGRGSPLDPRQF